MKTVKEEALDTLAELLTLVEAFQKTKCECMDADPAPDCPHGHARRWKKAVSHARALVKAHRAAKTAN